EVTRSREGLEFRDAAGNLRHLIRPGEDPAFKDVYGIRLQTDRLVHLTANDGALFRNFASLEPTREAILGFANSYGMLWESEVGVPFAEWEYEIKMMRFLVEIWDA